MVDPVISIRDLSVNYGGQPVLERINLDVRRGEVMVLLVNFGDASFTVTRGARIAQLVIAPVLRARIVEATDLDPTARGAGGFGSTGQ